VVEREPEGDLAPSVMSGQSELTVTKGVHDRQQVPRNYALGVRAMV
jgi:hypothetical protein